MIPSLVLDHVGIAVESLEAGRLTYQRLGFNLTPPSVHSGSRVPGGPVEPWGSGNHCAMFEQGYLEILGIVDAALYSSARALLDRYQGAHIIALGCDDADAAFAALGARQPGIQAPAALERDAAFGPDGRDTRRARFRNIYTDPARFPEAKWIVIEHQTRDVLWQPHLLSHPNGVVAITEAAICTDDVVGTARRLAATFGVAFDAKDPGIARLELARGILYVLSPAMVPKWAKGVEPPAVPSVVGVGFSVRDLAQTKHWLGEQAVAFESHPYPAIWVRPEHTLGPVVSFIQA